MDRILIITFQTFANPEDALSKKAKVAFGNEEIERVRR